MQIIFNMVSNYEGTVEINGMEAKNNDEVLKHIVYVGGEVNQYNSLFQGKLKDILKMYNLMYDSFDQEFAESMLASFDIKLKNQFNKLSTGNKTLVQNTLGLATRAPITILDEPTNNLEIKSISILENALNQYRGAILLVSHDEMFVKNIKTDKEITL